MNHTITTGAADLHSNAYFSRRVLLALLASLALHSLLLFGRQLSLSPLPELKPLEIRMVRTAPDLVPGNTPPPPAAKPKKRQPTPTEMPPQNQGEARLAEPQEPEVPPPEPEVANTTPEATDAAPSETPPDVTAVTGTAWPRAGRIVYALQMGEKRLAAGSTTHQWEVADDATYRIRALTEPASVAMIPWFKPGRTLLTSSGRVTAKGLQPQTFIERREGVAGEIRVDMDAAANEISFVGGKAPLAENTQDVLSYLYQLGYPGAVATGLMTVTDGSRMDGYRLETLGEDELEMPFGETLRALRVRARFGPGKEMIDVWLAVERFGLPLQIRRIDPKGVVYYWIANDIKVAMPLPAP